MDFPNRPHIPHVKHVCLRADDPLDILAAVEEGWLIRSRDGGSTWANLTDGTEFDSHTAYFIPPREAQVIVRASGSGAHLAIYRSSDQSRSWTRPTAAYLRSSTRRSEPSRAMPLKQTWCVSA